MAFGVLVLAYAILLRGLAAPLPSLPGSLDAALTDPHYLCLTEGNDQGAPSHHSTSCDDCCLGLTRLDAPSPPEAPMIAPWPRRVWRPASLHLQSYPDGPPDEAWALAHSQRGPPESRTPTSFT